MISQPQFQPGNLAHWVHRILLGGLVVSGLLLIFGLAIVFVFQEPRPVITPEGGIELLKHVAKGGGVATLNLGLFILILTPGLRVLVLAIGWCLERDWVFAAVALAVFVLLALSLTLGMG